MCCPLKSAGFAGRALRGRVLAAGLATIIGTSAGAQDARVYVANSANSRILGVQFDPPTLTVLNDDANALRQARDIALRDDGLQGANLIVCDRNGGRVVFYQSASGTGQVIFDRAVMAGPARPDGASLDRAGNLYVMNSGQGNATG